MTPPKSKDKKDTVALTLRLPETEWERLSRLALTERSSIQKLMVEALNLLYEDRGQRQIKIPAARQRVRISE